MRLQIEATTFETGIRAEHAQRRSTKGRGGRKCLHRGGHDGDGSAKGCAGHAPPSLLV